MKKNSSLSDRFKKKYKRFFSASGKSLRLKLSTSINRMALMCTSRRETARSSYPYFYSRLTLIVFAFFSLIVATQMQLTGAFVFSLENPNNVQDGAYHATELGLDMVAGRVQAPNFSFSMPKDRYANNLSLKYEVLPIIIEDDALPMQQCPAMPGDQYITFIHGEFGKLARVKALMSRSKVDISSLRIEAETDKLYVDFNGVVGVTDPEVYINRSAGYSVFICPGIESIDALVYDCENSFRLGYEITGGTASQGSITVKPEGSYYVIAGLVRGGVGRILSSDLEKDVSIKNNVAFFD